MASFNLYEITSTGKVIGKGAYGRVIEVYVHGTLCAAKEVHSILVEDVSPEQLKAMKELFFNECVRSLIHHPNVVQMLGVYHPSTEALLPWLVMEMMECSLTGFLDKYKKGKVPLHVKLSILVDVSQGLEFLHSQDIIHRDLSSNNVLLTKHCVAKISDFGAAKIISHNPMITQTRAPGTLYFMPPEALSVKPVYGKPVDVFSLGCVACHAMSHQWPQPKDQVQPGTFLVLTEVQRRDDYLQSFTESSFRCLIESCLHNEPDSRPKISEVYKCLKVIKLRTQQTSVGTTDYIELLNIDQQRTSYLPDVVSTGRVIGTGLYGRVLEVSVHGTLCAAKETKCHSVGTSEAAKEFVTECRSASRIRHPNVVQVLGIHYPTPEAKLPWLVMELMECSLTEFLKKYEKDKVSLNFKLSILVDISQGLKFLHNQDIIHWDLSSNNVFLTKQFEVKIADIGVAKVIKQNQMGNYGHKIHFMPPEVLSSKSHFIYDKPVDVFSLGCVACHVISHRWPVPMDKVLESGSEMHRREIYLQSCFSPALKKLVKLCLSTEPDQRPDVSAIHIKLKEIKAGMTQQMPITLATSVELFNAANFCLPDVTSTGRVVGKGTYGQVLEVVMHGTLCAAKQLNINLFQSKAPAEFESIKTAFLTECICTSRVRHPNVVQVLGIHYPNPEAKLPWLVMELMETNLTNFLEKYNKDKVPLHIKLSILVDISQGLEFLHEQDIVHGHLSSNKILLTKQSVAKISDLSVVKITRGNLDTAQTPSNMLHFVPPESLLAQCYEKPVDMFSLACVVLHVMSHRWPVPTDVQDDTQYPTDGIEIKRREEYTSSCNQQSLKQMVESCLHSKPNKRVKINFFNEGLKVLRDTHVPLATINWVELLDKVNQLQRDLEVADIQYKNLEGEMEDIVAEKDKKIQQLQQKLAQAMISSNPSTLADTCTQSTSGNDNAETKPTNTPLVGANSQNANSPTAEKDLYSPEITVTTPITTDDLESSTEQDNNEKLPHEVLVTETANEDSSHLLMAPYSDFGLVPL